MKYLNSSTIKVSLDIDDTLGGFYFAYKDRFKNNPKAMENLIITKNVYKLRKDKAFWLSIPKIDSINFIPISYCTKRIIPKSWSRQWLVNNNFPNRPIYQMVYQKGNKARMIKGRCDVLIDDSPFNVKKCIESGVPALLIDRPHNSHVKTRYRIYSLDIEEICNTYNKLFND